MNENLRNRSLRRERIAGLVVFILLALAFGWLGYRLVQTLHATEPGAAGEAAPARGSLERG